MDLDVVAVGQDVQVVDPEVRAHVYSLVTALGGFNGADVSKYSIGDDALACLRDIKKWLKLYDDKTNRLDVARCLGEANLVNGDLLPILSLWFTHGGHSKKHLTRVALACLELLVPLTWPVEVHSQMTVNHHRHTPYLQQVQVQYKRGLLDQHAGLDALRAIIGIGLPSLSLPKSERTNRDDGILKLMLYLFRNVAMITAPKGLVTDAEEEEISRSATINAFQQQQVFGLLLTMCSNINDDFSFQDVVLLEILFHLVKGVDVQKLFMNDTERKAKRNDELGDLLQMESGVSREYAKTAPTRHGRFGTMIWVKRDDSKVSTLSGQDILKDGQAALNKMDQTKKWNRPKHGRRQEPEAASGDFSSTTHLIPAAYKNLRTFVEEFLDTGFNPLFTHVRKAIEREADRVVDINTRQWLYLVGWFLQAERERRSHQRKQREKAKGTSKEIEPDSFSLVAGVLNQETFVFLNRAMQYSFDNKEWRDLNANMRCFTQILLTIQEMTASSLEEDQEIAENILNRIFYEETTHDRILSIVRGYKDQGFDYLDACTELAQVFLRMLENYSKENMDMQVRSKRRSKRAKKTDSEDQNAENEEGNDSEAEELADAARVATERKFDFKRFSARFCNQKSVDTFVLFTAYYRELDDQQLKRAHRFFYRVAFKQELSILLFRVDILNLFYRMIKGPGSLDSTKAIYGDWQELVKQLTRKMIKKLSERPALFTEMLFSKVNSTLFFLEYGHEKQTLSSGGTRPPAELEVHPRAGTSKDTSVNIVAAALIIDGRADLAKWLSETLGSAANERSSWEAEQTIRQEESPDAPVTRSPIIEIRPPNDAIQTAMFRNGRIRLLMKLAGLERLGVEDVLGSSWCIPSSLDSAALGEIKSIIDKGLENPVTEIDGLDPREQLRRKPTAEPRETFQTTLDVDFGSESEGEDAIPDGLLFPPNIREKPKKALEELKEKRRKRQKRNEDKEPLDDSIIEERRRNREENARARQAKIKSSLFVHDSDDESDEEADRNFFEREEAGRKAQDTRVREALVSKALEEEDASANQASSKKTNRRKKRSINDDDDDDQGENDTGNEIQKRPRISLGGFELSDEDENEDDDVLMTGINDTNDGSSKGASTSQGIGEHETPPTSTEHEEWDLNRELNNHKEATVGTAHANDSDEDTPVASNRRRGRAGFVIDSDSE